MNEFVEKLLLTIISLIVGSFIGAFINSWWKRPKLSFEVSNKRNCTFFFKPVDNELKLKGELKHLHYIVIQIDLTSVSNRGDETKIADSKLRLKTIEEWSKWFPYKDCMAETRYDTPYDFAIGVQESMIGRYKKAVVPKNEKLGGCFLIFEPAIKPKHECFECELKIIPVKGRPAKRKFRVYEYSSSN